MAAPARVQATKRADIAVFLAVKESLPIPAPTEPFRVQITGLRFVPAVAACVVDGKVSFTNDQLGPVTVLVEQKPVLELKPGETQTYDCTSTDKQVRRIEIKEWPHMRASLFTEAVGVVAQPTPGGAFALQAPKGKYELRVVTADGLIEGAQQSIELDKTDVDVGHLRVPGAGDPALDQDGGADGAKAVKGKGLSKAAAGKKRPGGPDQNDDHGSGQ